ncbi:MAG TPA: ATP-binding protein [Micromonosporaceae bacterium]|nr:ATP-binding protein [Micromonosporaceae bacterium]
MLVQLLLQLPRDAASVPLARRVLDTALASVDVTEQCRSDIGLALSEACGNVVDHAVEADRFEVKVSTEERRCVIEVVNAGDPVDRRRLLQPMVGPEAERGRGLHIIRAVMDVAEVVAGPAGGLAIRMIKKLVFTHPDANRSIDPRAMLSE